MTIYEIPEASCGWTVAHKRDVEAAITFVTILACQIGTTALVMSYFVIPLLKPDEQRKLVPTRGVSILVGLAPIPFALFVPGLLDTIFSRVP